MNSVRPSVSKSWCYTQLKVVNCSYTWTISNFSFCPEKTDEYLKSSTFSAGADDDVKWCLNLYPRGIREDCKDCLSLYLALDSSNELEVQARCEFSIISSKREEMITRKMEDFHSFVQDGDFGYEKFITRDDLLNNGNSYLPKDELTILCKVSMVTGGSNISCQSDIVKLKVQECKLSDDFGNLFDNKKFSDVTLAVDGHEFQAHKAILAARSEVFAAMFEHEMVERKLNRVVITDVDKEVLKEMLRYIYTGKAPNLYKMAGDLLAVADKYALEKLKEMCEEELCIKLNVEKAAETLVLADRYNAEQLKTKTIDFINTHGIAVMESQGWLNMITEHSRLFVETLQALVIQRMSVIKF